MENFTGATNASPFNSWLNGKWFTDNSGVMLDMYARQFKTMANALTDFYQLMDPLKNSRAWSNGSPYDWNSFMNRYFRLMNGSFAGISDGGNVLERMNQSYSGSLEHFSRYNQDIFGVFQKQLQKDEKDFHQFHQVIDKFMNDQLQLSQQVLEAVSTALNNRISFHSEIGRKTAESLLKQQEILNEQSKKIMEEWNIAFSNREKTEAPEKIIKKRKEELVPA